MHSNEHWNVVYSRYVPHMYVCLEGVKQPTITKYITYVKVIV